MSLQQFLQDVSYELQDILWRDVPHRAESKELDRLKEELKRASTALLRLRRSMHELRQRLAHSERQAHALKAHVEVYLHVADQVNAWRYALELDQLQHMLAHERARLERRRQAYDAELARVQHLQDRLDGCSFQMYSRR